MLCPNEDSQTFLTKQRSTFRCIPHTEWLVWADRCKVEALARYPYAEAQERFELQERFITLPHRALPRPPRRHNAAQRRKWIARNLRYGEQVNQTVNRAPPCRNDETSAVIRATHYAYQGAIGKAARTISKPSAVAPINETTKSIITALHPRAPEDEQIPDLPKNAPRNIITTDLTRYAITKRMARAAAPGPDGWTRELLVPLTFDNTCMLGLAALVQDIGNGDVSPWVREVITAGTMIPFLKPETTPETPKIRNIIPESAMSKLPGLCVFELCRDSVPKAVSPKQFGIGKGVEKGVHHARNKIDDGNYDVSIDIKNAYGTMLRSTALTEVYNKEIIAPLWRYLNMIYGKPTILILHTPEGPLIITNNRGLNQGQVASPVVFSIGVDPIVRYVDEQSEAGGAAYIDDIHIFDKDGKRATTTLRGVDARLHRCGMTRNTTKLDIYGPEGAEPLIIDGIASKGWVKVFGAPAGHDSPAMSRFCEMKVAKMNTFFRLAVHPLMPKKVQFALMRTCTTSRIIFLQRTTPQDITECATQMFDMMHKDAMKAFIGADVCDNETTMSLAYLPLRVGGLGLRPATLTQAIAYECSTGTEARSQKEVTAQIEEDIFDALQMEPDQQARCLSGSGTGATRYATHFSTSMEHKVSDAAFLAAVRTRIGLAPFPATVLNNGDIPITCRCHIDAGLSAHDHALLCPRSKGDAKRVRHDAVKEVVVEYLRSATAFVYPEPPDYIEGSAKRPDVLCRTPTTQVAIEVSVTHPMNRAARHRASTEQGVAGHIRCAEKTRKYAAICAARGDYLVPLIVETFGTINEEFFEFLELLPRNSSHPERLHQMWRDNFLAAISCAVQEGNYEMWRRYVHGPSVVLPI